MGCDVVVGGFFGDEGKGKVVGYLSIKDNPSIAVRGGVGPNAGHTVTYNNRTLSLRLLPCSVINQRCRLLIGPGVLINPEVLLHEIDETSSEPRVGIDKQCAVIEPRHIEAEKQSSHLAQKIGTTKSGVGPCNADRALRTAMMARDHEKLAGFLTDVPGEIHSALERNEDVLVEGTQGIFLSLYHGTYPYCTTKDVSASAVCSDVGIGPTMVENVMVVFKAYVTRVGEGFLEGELSQEEAQRRGWQEFGTVTRRPRRAAPFDYTLAKRAVKLNGATEAAVTKLDMVYPKAAGARNYTELTVDAREFIENIEREIGIPVSLVGTGPSVTDIIDRRS